MRNVESSPWLTQPELVEIKSIVPPGSKDSSLRINEFTLTFHDQARGAAARIQAGRDYAHNAVGAAGQRRADAAGQGRRGMNLDDLRRLNIRDIGNWPMLPKALALVALFLAILAGGAVLDWKDQYDALDKARQDEAKLKEQYAQKKAKAINFQLYVQQLKEIEQSFGALLKQLPNKSEMDALLTDINQAGLGRGLQFELFKPATTEKMADFYAELPINIRITGNYHDMGAFASDVAQLPRIVTLNDVVVNNDKGMLSMDAVAKTFRYLDEEEIAKQRKAAKDAKDAKQKGKK